MSTWHGSATAPSGPVVVGVDGSSACPDAVAWAADEAVLRGSAVEVLYIRDRTRFRSGERLVPHDRGWARRVLGIAAGRVRKRWPDLALRTTIDRGDSVLCLLTASTRAGMLVLGMSEQGGPTAGSVAEDVAAAADCPVLVVPPGAAGRCPDQAVGRGEHDDRVVLVGVHDGDCLAAVGAAFDEAVRRKQPVRAVCAWRMDDEVLYRLGGEPGPGHEALDMCERLAWEAMLRNVGPVSRRYDTVPLLPEVLPGAAADLLSESSRSASVVVMPSRRGRDRLAGGLDPSIRELLPSAHAPVLVVPSTPGV